MNNELSNYFPMRLIALIILSLFMIECNSKLLMVYEVGRHGYRSGTQKFDDLTEDPSQMFDKSKGYLTKLGVKQSFDIGLDLIKRYGSLDIKQVKTSDKTRAKITAASQLVGMYGSDQWKKEMIAFTKTTSTMEINSIDVFPNYLKDCIQDVEKYVNIEEDSEHRFYTTEWNWPMFKTLFNRYLVDEEQQLLSIKSKIDKWNDKYYPIDRNDTYNFCDTIESLNIHGVKLNSKIFNSNSDIFQNWHDYNYNKRRDLIYKNPLVSKLYSSELLKDIASSMETTIEKVKLNQSNTTLFYFDSCHGHNQWAILHELAGNGEFDENFGKSLLFELHEEELTHTFIVKLFLDDEELLILDSLQKLDKERSNHQMLFNDFKSLITSKTIKESISSICEKNYDDIRDIEIDEKDKDNFHQYFLIIIWSLASIIFIWAIIVFIFCIVKLKKDTQEETVIEKSNNLETFAGSHHELWDEL